MSQDVLHDWIAPLLSTCNSREIARLVHVGQDRIRAVRAAQTDHMRFLHQMGRRSKITTQIKQAVIDITLQHPNFADLQIAQIISERFAIPIAHATITRLRHLAHFSECNNRWLFLANLKRARYSRTVTHEIREATSLF
jgi:hypothetical protein